MIRTVRGLLLWECMGASDVKNLVVIAVTMSQYSYIVILKENLQQNADILYLIQTYAFYQYNDPKYTALNTQL